MAGYKRKSRDWYRDKYREAAALLERNPKTTLRELRETLGIVKTTASHWRTSILGKREKASRQLVEQPTMPLDKALAALSEELLTLAGKLLEAVPHVQALQALEASLAAVTDLKLEAERLSAQRRELHDRLLARSLAVSGESSLNRP